MGERFGNDHGSTCLAVSLGPEPEPVGWVLRRGSVGRHPQGQAAAGQRGLTAIDHQPQIILPLGVEKVDPGGIERLVRLDLKPDFGPLKTSQISLPLPGLRRPGRVIREAILSFADQQRGSIDHEHVKQLQSGIASRQAEPDRTVKPGRGRRQPDEIAVSLGRPPQPRLPGYGLAVDAAVVK